jgi:hypothetical protein
VASNQVVVLTRYRPFGIARLKSNCSAFLDWCNSSTLTEARSLCSAMMSSWHTEIIMSYFNAVVVQVAGVNFTLTTEHSGNMPKFTRKAWTILRQTVLDQFKTSSRVQESQLLMPWVAVQNSSHIWHVCLQFAWCKTICAKLDKSYLHSRTQTAIGMSCYQKFMKHGRVTSLGNSGLGGTSFWTVTTSFRGSRGR